MKLIEYGIWFIRKDGNQGWATSWFKDGKSSTSDLNDAFFNLERAYNSLVPCGYSIFLKEIK